MGRSTDLYAGARAWTRAEGERTSADAIGRRINGERLVVLGWGRAILMQFAHPLVAAAVHDHSTFRAHRLARLQRLQSTVGAMLALTFGSEPQVDEATRHIRRIHDRVHGTLEEAAGPFPAGTRYSAHDPELLRWVHATLLDSVPRAYERFVGPLTPEEKDRYCREAMGVAIDLGIPARLLPESMADVTAYLEERFASGEIVVTETARTLARDVLHPPFQSLYWPIAHATRLATIGTLDPRLQAQYGFTWQARHGRALARWTTIIRRTRTTTPDRLWRWQPDQVTVRGTRRSGSA